MPLSVSIIYKDKHICVIKKPVGMPSQSDPTGDTDALTDTKAALEKASDSSALWLIHRLDRNVAGLLVFARTRAAAAELSRLVSEGEMNKRYLAVCEGKGAEGELCDYLFKDSISNKSFVVSGARRGAKKAITYSSLLGEREERSLLELDLKTGRFHQIRCQLASRKNPLVGDKKYGSRDAGARTPALFAYRLGFTVFGKKYEFCEMPDSGEYPWSTFKEELKKI